VVDAIVAAATQRATRLRYRIGSKATLVSWDGAYYRTGGWGTWCDASSNARADFGSSFLANRYDCSGGMRASLARVEA
jgi:hypothetical protein